MGKRKKGKKDKALDLRARAYEAAIATPQRRHVIGADQSQDAAAEDGLSRIRDWGRYLDENHDLASGILDELVKNVVGSGIQTIPKPLNPDGSINEALGSDIMAEWKRWARVADVTTELSWHEAQRLICRGWFRDGEEFIQHVAGRSSPYPFSPADVPYRLELLESDMVPIDLTTDDGWRQGVRLNEWRAPSAYGVHRVHPNDMVRASARLTVGPEDVKVVNAAQMTHIKFVKRWPATRGISVFSTIISRLYDIKDLEESERIKNRILASWTAAVQRSPDIPGVDDSNANGERFLSMSGGTVIDTLAPGETIVGVGPEYPVAEFPDHIADQTRRLASGSGTRYSSIAKRYDGNYASQRQEMVESEGHYQIREDQFVSKVCATVYERWLAAAIGVGMVSAPGYDMSPQSIEMLTNAEYRGPVTPWIDPLKEAQADALMVAEGFASIDQIRIKRGAPAEMIGTPPPAKPQPMAPRAPAQLSLIEDDEEDAA